MEVLATMDDNAGVGAGARGGDDYYADHVHHNCGHHRNDHHDQTTSGNSGSSGSDNAELSKLVGCVELVWWGRRRLHEEQQDTATTR